MNFTKEFKEEIKKDFKVKANDTFNIFNYNHFTTNFIIMDRHIVREYTALNCLVILMNVDVSFDVTINGLTEFVITGKRILIKQR